MRQAPRIAIVHDYLTQRGGAERVVLALLRIFPEARLITSVYRGEGTFPEFAEKRVETTWLNHLSVVRQDPRRALPLLAPTFGRMEIADVDVVIASSSGWAPGVQTSAPKIVYCYNPPRWLHQPEEYLAGLGALPQLASRAMTPYLRRWDRRAAASASAYVGISTPVVDRIRRAYGREALLVPPPVTIDVTGPREPVEGIEPGFLLTVARARGYKNTDVVIDAMHQLTRERLVVVGETRHSARVCGVGRVSDAQMRWLYANCGCMQTAGHWCRRHTRTSGSRRWRRTLSVVQPLCCEPVGSSTPLSRA
jgi:glycosyltransferase involved in cell wall biosynthesis